MSSALGGTAAEVTRTCGATLSAERVPAKVWNPPRAAIRGPSSPSTALDPEATAQTDPQLPFPVTRIRVRQGAGRSETLVNANVQSCLDQAAYLPIDCLRSTWLWANVWGTALQFCGPKNCIAGGSDRLKNRAPRPPAGAGDVRVEVSATLVRRRLPERRQRPSASLSKLELLNRILVIEAATVPFRKILTAKFRRGGPCDRKMTRLHRLGNDPH